MRRFVHPFAVVLAARIACDRPSDKAGGVGDAAPGATVAWLREDAADARRTDAAAALPPLPPQPPFADLPVPGFPDAVVSLPNGAMSARPVLIALHGSGEKPDRSCDMWRQMTGARGFVVCPRNQEVLFGCASAACLPNAKAAATNLEKAGVESHVVHAEAKRTNDESMQAAILDEKGSFLGDDARWGESGRRLP